MSRLRHRDDTVERLVDLIREHGKWVELELMDKARAAN